MSNNDTQAPRHSGPVQVRGRIRRVWRPRHLELYADGHVKYYDASAAATEPSVPYSTSSPSNALELKYTLQISSARILDGVRDLSVGLPRGTFGFVLQGQRVWNAETEHLPSHARSRAANATPPFSPYASTAQQMGSSFVLAEAVEPMRDYWCAVDSLEEAQMWVVALQWAARMRESAVEGGSWWKVEYAAAGKSAEPKEASQLEEKKERKSSSSRTPTTATFSAAAAPTKVLVAKVTGCTFVRVSTFALELAYTIDVMLLSTTTTAHKATGYPVEEWSLVRTAQEFQTVEPQQQPIPTWKTLQTATQLQNAVSTLDSILRSWVLSPDMVQTNPAFLQFLALTNDTPPPTRWWQIHSPSSVRTTRTESISYPPPHAFVQSWLQQRSSSFHNNHLASTAVQHLLLLRRHWWWWGGAALVAWPVAQRALAFLPSRVPMRLDGLLLSWAGAAYWGYRHGQRKVIPETRKTKEASTASLVMKEQAQEEDDDAENDDDEESDGEEFMDSATTSSTELSPRTAPLPEFPGTNGTSCWSRPPHTIFHVRGRDYFRDKVKIPSQPAPLQCRGVDVWLTDNPVRHISQHSAVQHHLSNSNDSLVINFLLPFANFVAYFDVPPLSSFPPKVRTVWSKFLQGDQQYRDARLKLLPVVVEGPCT